MKRALPYQVREVLRLLNNKEFIVTGSLSLKLQGLLSRESHDLDIITTDKSIIDILSKECQNLSETIETGHHYRFLYYDSLFIDVFFKAKFPYIVKSVGEFTLKLSPDWCVFNTKFKYHKDDTKTLQDVQDYFKQKELLTIKYL